MEHVQPEFDDEKPSLLAYIEVDVEDVALTRSMSQNFHVRLDYDEHLTYADVRRLALRRFKEMLLTLNDATVDELETLYQASMLPPWERDALAEDA
jgi:hypothetical protein